MTAHSLPTATGVYEVRESPYGLLCQHWGPPGQAAVAGSATGHPSSWLTQADVLPLEVTALGTRIVTSAELVMSRPGGMRGARLSPEPATLSADGPQTHLRQVLTDAACQVRAEVHVLTDTRHEAVRKWAVVHNTGSEDLVLERAFGAAWSVPAEQDHITALAGGWSRELTPAQTVLRAGTFSVGSRQGITSHTFSPVLTFDDGSAPQARVLRHGIALAWSGSWRMSADAVPLSPWLRIAGGPDDESGRLRLAPGQKVRLPEMAGIAVVGDSEDLAQAWHAYERTLTRGAADPEDLISRRPVVYNSWYGTGFDVRPEHQLELAREAAGIGAEAFVVDDGWFRGRTSDRGGLGDWQPDPDVFPEGLDPLIEEVNRLGMRFGIWVEPEAVSPRSDLYRAHPEWAHQAAGRPLVTMRHQHVLDLGLPEVEEFVLETLRDLLHRHRIDYLKWDMNRPISDGGQSRPGGADWSWRHTRAYHRILRALREELPHVSIEACAGGGGRIDLAVLELTDVVWPSDETGPRDRLAIQHGFLSAYPAWTMSSWVTDEPDRLDTEPASLAFRFVVAMAGVLGLGADLLAWTGKERALARELVRRYRRIRPVILGGTVRRHGSAADAACALEYRLGGQAVVLAWRRRAQAGPWSLTLADGVECPIEWSLGDCDIIETVAAAP